MLLCSCAEETLPHAPVSFSALLHDDDDVLDDPCAVGVVENDDENESEASERLDVGGGLGAFNFPVTCDEVKEIRSNLGCEFWAVDLPNEWRGTSWSPPAAEQQFSIVVANSSSLQIARVTVYLGDSDEIEASALVGESSTYEFKLAAQSIDARENSADGRAFRVVSDQPIIAYQFNPLDNSIEVYSNDASLLLPSHSLGKDYAAVTGDGILLSSSENDPNPAPAGAFVSVVATQDETEISVFPTAEVLPGPTSAILLNRGEVFTVLSDAMIAGTNLSGTRVHADKAVAVFSGNVAAIVPAQGDHCCADHLEQQMLPYSAWGSAYTVTPVSGPKGKDNPTTFRFVGAYEDTVLEYCPERPEGAPVVLRANESAVFESSTPFTVRSKRSVALG